MGPSLAFVSELIRNPRFLTLFILIIFFVENYQNEGLSSYTGKILFPDPLLTCYTSLLNTYYLVRKNISRKSCGKRVAAFKKGSG